jgi:OTU domain-containing protein 3
VPPTFPLSRARFRILTSSRFLFFACQLLLSDPAQNTQLLTEQLRSLGLYAAPTLGDGNCLFRALSDQLYGTPSHHLQLRKDICDWIEAHQQRYEPFVEDERGLEVHLRCMRENGTCLNVTIMTHGLCHSISSHFAGTYGGHLELSAFAHFARRNVKVIQPGLVYVIEWAAGGDLSPTRSKHADLPGPEDDSKLDEREKRRMRRDQKRAEKERTELSKTDSDSSVEVVYVALVAALELLRFVVSNLSLTVITTGSTSHQYETSKAHMSVFHMS